MKRIVVLGNSPAGLSAIEQIIQKSKDFSFTIVSYDGALPAARESHARLIGKNIKPSEFFLRNKNYFDTNKMIREALAEAGFPAPMPAQSVILTQSN